MTDDTIDFGCSFRAVEPAVGERQQRVCAPQPAVDGSDVLPRAHDATARLRLLWVRLQEPGPALHALNKYRLLSTCVCVCEREVESECVRV